MIKNLLILFLTMCCIVATAQSSRPNIVLFVMDDMGWQDTSVSFWKEKTAKNRLFSTPSMERLAAVGTKFSNAYMTPEDRATQISLRTAMSTAQHKAAIINKATSLTNLLKNADYITVRCSGANAEQGVVTTFDFDLSSPGLALSELTSRALSQVDSIRAANKPFFLDFHAVATDSTIYSDKCSGAVLMDDDARYALKIESMDSSLGRIMDYLETNELIQNTTIIVVSDCGGDGINTKNNGVGNVQNYPLRAGKGSLCEGGTRVPLIIKQQLDTTLRECAVQIQAVDIMPTILDVAGVKYIRARQRIDGRSILPVIRNSGRRTRAFVRSLYWHSPHNIGTHPYMGYGAASSIVSGNWKLIYYYTIGKTELFNLKDDIFEISNQAVNKSVSHIRERLANELTRHLKSKRAEIPAAATYPNGSRRR